MNTAPTVRLHLFFATDNDDAVILRRARDKEYNLVGWDRATDTFIEGQWIRKYVSPSLCSLSPDGRHFMYYIANADPRRAASEQFTAISRPPWFTALALFPQGGTWRAGGSFLTNKLFWIEGDVDDLIGRAGDLHRIVHGKVTKDCRTGLRLVNGKPAPLGRDLRERLLAGDSPKSNSQAFDRYETEEGRLYRRKGSGRDLIADFTVMEPKFVRAPYDDRTEHELDSGWHPLDGEAGR